MRVIVFSGKGGSGVSTMAAATATALAQSGRRTLAFALGEGLAACFGRPLASEAVQVDEALWAAEGRTRYDRADELRDWLGDLLEWRGLEAGLAEDLAALPGVSHVGRLLELEAQAAGAQFEALVVDGGPLPQFLDLPPALDAASRWLERLFAPREQTLFEPFLRVFVGEYAAAGDDVFERGRALLTRLARLRETLTDPAVSSVRLVLGADAAAVGDVQKAVATLSLFGCTVDALVVNRMLPDEAGGEFLATLREEQEAVVSALGTAAAPLPVLAGPLTAAALRGVPSLAALAGRVYDGLAPADVLHRGPTRGFFQEDGCYVLRLALPFVSREELGLEQTEDSVEVHLDGRRCVVPLPHVLRYREAQSWSLESQVLRVVFRA